jgi:apolipoprotein N-acyltransferase
VFKEGLQLKESPGCDASQSSPETEAAPGEKRTRARLVGPALATSIVLWLCYFPANLGWLAWIALVPMLVLVRAPGGRLRIFGAAYLSGLVFNLLAIQWMRVADTRMYMSWVGVSIYCAVFFALGIVLTRILEQRSRLPLVLAFPAAWCGLEFVRAHFLGGFAWYFLGHTQHDQLLLIQIADVTGVYGITFLVAATNVVVFELLCSSNRIRALYWLPARWSGRGLAIQGAIVLALIVADLIYGCSRLEGPKPGDGPQLALLQGNLDQRLKNAASDQGEREAITEVVLHYRELCDQAAAPEPRPELIVWPETSYPQDWIEIAEGAPEGTLKERWLPWRDRSLELVRLAAKRWQTDMLMGMNADELGADEKPRRFNSALLFRKDATLGGRYDKVHRIPFGEYVPLRDWLPWLKVFTPYDWDYSVTAGERLTRFQLGGYHFGVLICYEDTDPWLARQYVIGGEEPRADFLINISNDGWFDGTSEHEEHLAICRFRAIEARRPIARAVNMGISGIIDANGRIVQLPGSTWKDSKKIAAVVSASVPLDTRASLYARWGDWFPSACWILVGAALLPQQVRRLRRGAAA